MTRFEKLNRKFLIIVSHIFFIVTARDHHGQDP